MKRCLTCGTEKELTEFSIDRVRKDGRYPHCKSCKSSEARSKRTKLKARQEWIRTRTKKPCSRCKLTLGLDSFHKRNSNPDGLSYVCKECVRAETAATSNDPVRVAKRAESWRRRKASTNNRHRKRRAERKAILISMCGGKCSKCGLVVSDMAPPVCFDFHHVDGKDYNVSSLTYSELKFLVAMEEVKRCVLMCANCHRAEHARDCLLDHVRHSQGSL